MCVAVLPRWTPAAKPGVRQCVLPAAVCGCRCVDDLITGILPRIPPAYGNLSPVMRKTGLKCMSRTCGADWIRAQTPVQSGMQPLFKNAE